MITRVEKTADPNHQPVAQAKAKVTAKAEAKAKPNRKPGVAAQLQSPNTALLQQQTYINHHGQQSPLAQRKAIMNQAAAASPQTDQRHLLNSTIDSPDKTVSQRVSNTTGLPDSLKSGIEQLSSVSMDHVKVHYNSPKPTQLNAHAYTQGSDIHVAQGQEKHLAHEAWHVVQQARGQVKPTTKIGNAPINDDPKLERDADIMGAKAAQFKRDNT